MMSFGLAAACPTWLRRDSSAREGIHHCNAGGTAVGVRGVVTRIRFAPFDFADSASCPLVAAFTIRRILALQTVTGPRLLDVLGPRKVSGSLVARLAPTLQRASFGRSVEVCGWLRLAAQRAAFLRRLWWWRWTQCSLGGSPLPVIFQVFQAADFGICVWHGQKLRVLRYGHSKSHSSLPALVQWLLSRPLRQRPHSSPTWHSQT